MIKFFLLKLLIFLMVFDLMAFTHLGEKMGINVIEKFDQKVILFKRGIEDGLKLNQHIRFRDETGFITRGVVLALDSTKFLAFVYHNYRPKALSTENPLIISQMPRHLVPDAIDEEISAIELNPYLQKIKYISMNLQQGKKKTVDKYLNESWDKKRFIGSNYQVSENPFDFKDAETSNIKFKAYASPMQWSSFTESTNFNLGFNFSAKRQEILRTDFDYDYQNQTFKDPFDGQKISHRRHYGEGVFDWKYLTNRWRLFAFGSFERAGEKGRNFLQKRVQIVPLGIDYLILSNNFHNVFLSMRPILEHQTLEVEYSDGTIGEKESNHMRFGLFFHSEKWFTNEVLFEFNMSYSPKFQVSEFKVDYSDNLFKVNPMLTYKFSQRFSSSYKYEYQVDQNRFNEFGLPNDIHTHSLLLNYNYE